MVASELRRHPIVTARFRVAPLADGTAQETFWPLGYRSGKRIDVLATAIWAGMTAEELAGSDLSYAPPLSPTYDPVIVAARVASRIETG